MTVVARTFVSVPVRSAQETWKAICELLAPDSHSAAHHELWSIAGVASSLIARETVKDSAIVASGSGPRARIYCSYHSDAIEGDDSNESALSFDATEGDWRVSLPCPADELAWVQAELVKKTNRITARDADLKLNEDEMEKESVRTFELKLDKEAFFRP